MGGGTLGGAPSFPLPVLAAVSLLLAIPLFLAGRRLQGDAARFLLFAIWLRYIMSVFHVVTYQQVAAGLSLNAIGSVAVTGLGLLIIPRRYLLLKALLPVHVLILLALASAQLNAGVFSALDTVVKYLYFCTLFVATYEALKENPPGRLFRLLLVGFAPLLVFQLLSVATGVVKASELDGSRSYIGGYNHESAFSVALATFFIAAAFAAGLGRIGKLALMALILVGIILANYRTTILALMPFVLFLAVSGSARLFLPRQRVVIAGLALCAGLIALAGAAILAEGRFGELAHFLGDPAAYIKPQESFTVEERRLLSGRVYIWSGYIHAWIESTPFQHLFGFGPDSWSDHFRVYPHNTLVAYLFELGLAGLLTLAWWWTGMIRLAAQSGRGMSGTLVLAQISFIILNLATMALWQIEGLILFAIVSGYSMYCARIARSERRQERVGQSAFGGEERIGPGFQPP